MIRPLVCFLVPLSLALVVWSSSSSAAGSPCGSVFELQVPPSDYNDPAHRRAKSEGGTGLLKMVERRHFTPRVEQLIGGQSTALIMADLAYTLDKFPNHHRALYALIRYERRLGGRLPQTGKPFTQSVDCYLERALQLRPNDPQTLQLVGMYHHVNGRYEKAIAAYEQALSIAASPQAHYNAGLAYVELGAYDKAVVYARAAYAAGYPLQGLRSKLEDQGLRLD